MGPLLNFTFPFTKKSLYWRKINMASYTSRRRRRRRRKKEEEAYVVRCSALELSDHKK
jgi:hypothetical protein